MPAANSSSTSGFSGKFLRILHVDDEEDFLFLTKTFLEKFNSYTRVFSVSCPKKALQLLENNEYDIVLSDYQMPSLNGLELLINLRQRGNTVPFAILTGRGREEVAIQALNLGADFYLQKSSNTKVLYTELNHYISRAVERKKAEIILIESEDRYRRIVESAGEGIWVIDENTNTTYVNNQLAEMFGFTPSEMNGKSFFAFVTAENLVIAQTYLERCRKVINERFDVKFYHKSGSIIHALCAMNPIYDKTGKQTGTLAMITDITARKQMEEALRMSEQKFKSISELAMVGIAIFHNNKILYVNDTGAKYLGFTKEEIENYWSIGDLVGVIHPDDRELLVERLTKKQAGEIVSIVPDIPFRVVTKTNAVRWLEAFSKTIFYGGKDVDFIISVDITDRINIENRLKNLVELEKMVSSLSTRFINIDPESINQEIDRSLQMIGQFFDVEYCFILQTLSSDSERLTCTSEWHAEGYEPVITKLGEIPFDDYPWFFEGVDQHGAFFSPVMSSSVNDLETERPVLQSFSTRSFLTVPMITRNTLLGYMGVLTVKVQKNWSEEDVGVFKVIADIFTNALERRRAEKALHRQKEELSLFLDLISHDLKNYHAISSGSIEIVSALLQEKALEEIPDLLEQSFSGITAAETVINNISLVLKLQMGHKSTLEPVNVLKTVEHVLSILALLYPERKIVVDLERISPTTTVLADSFFEHLLLNLLTNAVKADPHDIVKLEIALESGFKDSACLLTVTDQGRGIPEDQRVSIFERFSSFKREGRGSGLGLFIVKKLVDRYQGTIWIESRAKEDYRKGTSFRIELRVP